MVQIPDKALRAISRKYNHRNNTLSREVKSNDRDRIELEIGDAKQPDFKPQIKIKRWDNEVNFSLRAEEDPNAVVGVDKNKIRYKAKDYEVNIYELDPDDVNEDGGVEFEWVVPEKPKSNVLIATIQTKGLDFFYQPPLTNEEVEQGDERPENVVGSYAVYHKTKGGMNRSDRREYKAGKAFHIYRPWIYDKSGDGVYGDLNIDQEKGLLTVTVPQDFLEKAVYPVVVDPTFGYTSIGASTGTMSDDHVVLVGNLTAVNGVLDSISTYRSSDSSVNTWKMAVYNNITYHGTSFYPQSADLVGETVEGEDTTLGWNTLNANGTVTLTSGDVGLSRWDESGFTSDYYYDTGTSYVSSDSTTYDGSAFPNPYGATNVSANNPQNVSIYATYTATTGVVFGPASSTASFDSTNTDATQTVADDGANGIKVTTDGSGGEISVRKDLTGDSVRTISFDFKVDSGATISGEQTILHTWADSFANDVAQIRLNAASSQYRLKITDPEDSYSSQVATKLLDKGTWYTIELALEDSAIGLYIDGEFQTLYQGRGKTGDEMAIMALGQFFSSGISGSVWFRSVIADTITYDTAPSTTAEEVETAWAGWKEKYLRSDGAIVRPNPDGLDGSFNAWSDVVSEGIAYALMLSVQLDDQTTFDLVEDWAYDNLDRRNNVALSDGLNLMAWHYDDVNDTVYDWNWATDSDIDRLNALYWAHFKWGSSGSINYKSRADAIAADFIDDVFRLDDGKEYQTSDSFQSSADPFEVNPSYLSPSTYRTVKKYDTANEATWDNAVDGAYDIITKNTDNSGNLPTTAGLPSDWVGYDTTANDVESIGVRSTDFGYEAFRLFYRIYWDYLHFSASEASTYLGGNILTFLQGEWDDHSAIYAEYEHDGTDAASTYEKSMMTMAYYFVFLANSDARASSVWSVKLANLHTQSYFGDYFLDGPSGGQSSYFSDSWMVMGMATVADLWDNLSPEIAETAPVSVTTNIPSVTATVSSAQTATVDPVTATATINAVTATHVSVQTADVSPVSATATIPSITASYVAIKTADVSPVSVATALPSVTATYNAVKTATLDPLVATTSAVDATATSVVVKNASVAPVQASAVMPAVTAVYQTIAEATVSPVSVTTTVVAVTASQSGEFTASVQPVIATSLVVGVTATYAQVTAAILDPVVANATVVGVTAGSDQSETAIVDPVVATSSVVDVTATYQSVQTADVAPLAVTSTIVPVTATSIAVYSAAVEALGVTTSIPAVQPTIRASAVVDPVLVQALVPAVTAEYDTEGLWYTKQSGDFYNENSDNWYTDDPKSIGS